LFFKFSKLEFIYCIQLLLASIVKQNNVGLSALLILKVEFIYLVLLSLEPVCILSLDISNGFAGVL
jgi:hypothetical protein